MRVVIYARVSTRDKQNAENQIRILKEYCERQKYTVVDVITDKESGAKSFREGLTKCQQMAMHQEIDLFLFWALDRVSRGGLVDCFNILRSFEKYGVAIHSYSEEAISSKDPLTRDLFRAILSIVAEYERIRIHDRIMAGLDRAKEQGKKLGRKALPNIVVDKIEAYLTLGYPYRKIVETLKADGIKVSKTSVQNVKKAMDERASDEII